MLFLAVVLQIFFSVQPQFCQNLQYQRCICTSSPYCPCNAITQTTALNFGSNYYSHLVLVSNLGCRPCAPSCLSCSSVSSCNICMSSYQLIGGVCIKCPINCLTCSNSVCSVCINGYYLNYQSQCMVCPIKGTFKCTMNSLISCLSNYWLDNNAANCISCDVNCNQCSSTTKCAQCLPSYYLSSNFACVACLSICSTCLDGNSCLTCLSPGSYYNSTQAKCVYGTISNCVVYQNLNRCTQCDNTSVINALFTCDTLPSNSVIVNCRQYAKVNISYVCRNCTVGLFNHTSGCLPFCSHMCTSCFGVHFGLCFGCVQNAYMLNYNCIPVHNLNQGATFQVMYTALNNMNIFLGSSILYQSLCVLQTVAFSSSSSIWINLNNLQSYSLKVKYKIYSYNVSNQTYILTFNNSNQTTQYNFTFDQCISLCSSTTCISKSSIIISGIKNTNTLTWTGTNNIGISQIIIEANRCGGIQGKDCLQCQSINVCTSCVDPNYYISGYTCVIACPVTNYVRTKTKTCYQQCPLQTFANLQFMTCIQCKYPCKNCQSQNTCLSCQVDFYLFKKQCYDTCPDQYYPSTIGSSCEPCVYPCLKCKSGQQCLSCLYGFYLSSKNQCVIMCGDGLFGSIQTLTCQNCSSNCATCDQFNGNSCKSCRNGLFLFENRCHQSCKQGFYANNEVCTPCTMPCLTCLNASYCQSCQINYYLQNSTCLQYCSIGYYSNLISLTCQLCMQQCQTCSSGYTCDTCKTSYLYFQIQKSCLTGCPFQYYAFGKICSKCQSPCLECTSQLQCSSCLNMFFYNKSCVAVCPFSTYQQTINMTCLACDSNCVQCYMSATTCTKCSQIKILFNLSCITQCPDSYYKSNSSMQCLKCSQQCKLCISLNNCSACKASYFLQNVQCTKQCSTGYFQKQNNCLLCNTNCSSCKNQSFCFSCKNNYTLFQGSCLPECPSKYFKFKQRCLECLPPCKQCLNEKTCISCNTNNLLFGNCISSCPVSQYSFNSTCLQCPQSCLTCSSQNRCIQCKNNYYLFNQSCLQSCPTSYYIKNYPNQCYPCAAPCKICKSYSICQECQSPYTLINQTCSLSCPNNYYRRLNQCLLCSKNCISCINASICLACNNSVLIQNYTCSTCPAKYFSKNAQCQQCLYPCLQCKSQTQCLSCQIGYLVKQSCLSACPISYYTNQSFCVLCSQNCSQCSSATKCQQCSSGYLVNGFCKSECSKRYFPQYSFCSLCSSGCQQCQNLLKCTSCNKGILFEGKCVLGCSDGWVQVKTFNQTSQCVPCVSGCDRCTSRPGQCLICSHGLYLYGSDCLFECKLGTYSNNDSGVCIACNYPCLGCSNGYSCQSCVFGHILYLQPSGNQCIQGSKCPNSYYLDTTTNTCVFQCSNNLYLSQNRQICYSQCPLNFAILLQNRRCVQKCPQKMWVNSNRECSSDSLPPNLPSFYCKPLILRNILIIQCQFSENISNINILEYTDFNLSQSQIVELHIINNYLVRLVTNQNINTLYSLYNLILLLKARYQLYNQKHMYVQNYQSVIFLPFYYSFSQEQRNTGMKMRQISFGLCISAFLFLFFSLVKNTKIYACNFIITLQWLYNISLLDIQLGPNLSQFLQGFSLSSLIFLLDSQDNTLWKISSRYRQRLWGVYNMYRFNSLMLASICLIFLFLIIFLSLFLILKYQKIHKVQQGNENQQQQTNKQIKTQIQIKQQQPNNYKLQQIQQQQEKSGEQINIQRYQQQKQQEKQQKRQNQNMQQRQQNLQVSKAQIIYNRFFFNYWYYCLLTTSTPLSLSIFAQFIAPRPLQLSISLLLFIIYLIIFYFFIKNIENKVLNSKSTKYVFITWIQILMRSSIVLFGTVSLFLGMQIILSLIHLYSWHSIFKSRVNLWKNSRNIQIYKILIIIQIFVGEYYKEKWSSDTYFSYCWIVVCTVFFMTIFVALFSNQLLFQMQTKSKLIQKIDSQISSNNQQKLSKFLLEQLKLQQQKQQSQFSQNNLSFFSEQQPVSQSGSQNDIIDFDESRFKKEAPKKLIKIDKIIEIDQ